MMGSCIWTSKEKPAAIQLLSSLQMVTLTTLWAEPCRKERYLKIRGTDSPGCRKKVSFYPIMLYRLGST